MVAPVEDEDIRAVRLIDAQTKAVQLFDAITDRGLVRPGAGEKQLSNEIRDLAAEMFGTTKFWHKRIVRSGINTLQPYRENPPDRLIEEDDIVFCDFGPIFEQWEADFGRTFVLGDDPVKHGLRDALPAVFAAGREHFEAHPDITGAQLYARVVELAQEAGWEFGGQIAGHLVGEFPHEKIAGDEIGSYIAPGSDRPMRRLDHSGRQCHWILEIHLVDRERGIGGFVEELLDLGDHRP
ncbi:M24 family metallopeptidase [Millisia brevis]|uniref:M24 family metallopeptidase n=1 Tax=Millisia brevis TaxID=264148 RepID=UPI0008296B6B|nr:M24 family metallopeptidase [Millisia brevis]